MQLRHIWTRFSIMPGFRMIGLCFHLFSLLLLPAALIYAQSGSDGIPTRQPLLSHTPGCLTERLRAYTRLLAESQSAYNGSSYVQSDSIRYGYAANRHYDFTPYLFALPATQVSAAYSVQDYFDTRKHWVFSGAVPTLTDTIHTSFDGNQFLRSKSMHTFTPDHRFSQTFILNTLHQVETETDSLLQTGSQQITQYVYTYNATTALQTMLNQVWHTTLSAWIPQTTDSLFYDASQHIQQIVSYRYDSVTTLWQLEKQYQYSYVPSGMIQEALLQYWDSSLLQMQDYYKTTYLYDGSNRLLSAVRFLWDGSSWLPLDMDSFQYAASVRPEMYMNAVWDSTGWLPSTRHVYTYTPDIQISTDQQDSWDLGLNQWNPVAIHRYYYELAYPEELPDIPDVSAYFVYPNPAHEVLCLHIPSAIDPACVMLCDSKGEPFAVPVTKIPDGLQYDLQQLPSGMYFIRIAGHTSQLTFIRQ